MTIFRVDEANSIGFALYTVISARRQNDRYIVHSRSLALLLDGRSTLCHVAVSPMAVLFMHLLRSFKLIVGLSLRELRVASAVISNRLWSALLTILSVFVLFRTAVAVAALASKEEASMINSKMALEAAVRQMVQGHSVGAGRQVGTEAEEAVAVGDMDLLAVGTNEKVVGMTTGNQNGHDIEAPW